MINVRINEEHIGEQLYFEDEASKCEVERVEYVDRTITNVCTVKNLSFTAAHSYIVFG